MKEYGTTDKCPACGSAGLFGIKFRIGCSATIPNPNAIYGPPTTIDSEGYLQRACPRCGYTWEEKPLYETEPEKSGGLEKPEGPEKHPAMTIDTTLYEIAPGRKVESGAFYTRLGIDGNFLEALAPYLGKPIRIVVLADARYTTILEVGGDLFVDD